MLGIIWAILTIANIWCVVSNAKYENYKIAIFNLTALTVAISFLVCEIPLSLRQQ